MDRNDLFKTKLWAWLHDPAEKALILLRGKAHDKGTVSDLREKIFKPANNELLDEIAKKADRWASAADRPSLPKGKWSSKSFAANAKLIHPLSTKHVDLGDISQDISTEAAESISFAHFSSLYDDKEPKDYYKIFLKFWRFGPELSHDGLESLWRILPADTRSPDHTIWDHLRLTSAFAGAMAGDKEQVPALMVISIGPVQDFIAQARTVSDLWSGSHLLSSLAFETMKPIIESYGPDSIIFPNLWGVPLVDVWLEKQIGKSFSDINKNGKYRWNSRESDSNPLFTAALPNRFMCVIPASEARDLAERCKQNAKIWLEEQAQFMLRELFPGKIPDYANEQVRRQLKNFPEFFWAAVPWSLAGKEGLDDEGLRDLLNTLGLPHDRDYLGVSGAVLRKHISFKDDDGKPVDFFSPNPGIAYPGIYEAVERLQASTKTFRAFEQSEEMGYRCSLCGEREWITGNRSELFQHPGERNNTVWDAYQGTGIARKGEHLCALCGLKRFWPKIFTKFVQDNCLSVDNSNIHRYVVSTHAMALSNSINNVVNNISSLGGNQQKVKDKLATLISTDLTPAPLRAALPEKLHNRLRGLDPSISDMLHRLPSALDDAADIEDIGGDPGQYEVLLKEVKELFGYKPESYYALVLMDGDRMGKWLSGDIEEKDEVLKLNKRFINDVVEKLTSKGGDLVNYLNAYMPPFPGWHAVISSALNNFSIHMTRQVIEKLSLGKLIYAGGDDVLAMSGVSDLLGIMTGLRYVYSGNIPKDLSQEEFWKLVNSTPDSTLPKIRHGFALLKTGRNNFDLLKMMGEYATASVGAVIAHHKTPLGWVLRELRAAEKRAKDAGRNAFCIALAKRAGGTTYFLGRWGDKNFNTSAMGLLIRAKDMLAHSGTSRRVAYILSEALSDVPVNALEEVLTYQFIRQGLGSGKEKVKVKKLCHDIAQTATTIGQELVVHGSAGEAEWPIQNVWIRNLLNTAEFLARSGRIMEIRPGHGKEVSNG